jgi:hypothetical protein
VNERQIIDECFRDTIATLYRTFFIAYTAALGDTAEEAQAEERFRNGVVHARHVRDRALALVP